MALDPKGKSYRRHSLHVFFSLGKGVQETMETLQTLFPELTLKEVDAWFTRFKSGNNDIETDAEIVDPRGLEECPVPVKRKIMEAVGYKEQKTLLQVNSEFRNVLKADRRLYEEIRFYLGMEHIDLVVKYGNDHEQGRFKYTKKMEQGCEISEGGKIKLSSDSYLDEGLRQFNKTIRKKGTKIKSLVFQTRQPLYVDEDVDKFYEGIGKNLSELEEKLHVEEIEVQIGQKKHLPPVLDAMKTGVLTCLRVQSLRDEFQYESEEIPSLVDHLKSVETIFTIKVRLSAPLNALENVRFAEMRLVAINPAEIATFKNTILRSREFQRINLVGDFVRREVLAALEPFKPTEEWEREDGSFPTSDGKRIDFTLSDSSILFSKVH